MAFLHITILIIGFLLGYLFRKKVLWFLISSFILSGIYAYAVLKLLPDQFFSDQWVEFFIRAFVIAICSECVTFFLSKKTLIFSIVAAVLILFASFYEDIGQYAQNQKSRINNYFNGPSSIEEYDSLIVYRYRFKQDNYIRIPKDLRECHSFLDSILLGKTFRLDTLSPVNMHFGLGMWMRNNWGLWSGKSIISKKLESSGIQHPDAMSALIIESYLLKLTLQKENKYTDSIFYLNTVDSIILEHRNKN